jgi:hypothetical protein
MLCFSPCGLMDTSAPLWVDSIVANRLVALASFRKTKWVDLNAVQTSPTSFVDLKNGNSRDRNVSVTLSGMVVLACQNGQKKTEIKKSKK